MSCCFRWSNKDSCDPRGVPQFRVCFLSSFLWSHLTPIKTLQVQLYSITLSALRNTIDDMSTRGTSRGRGGRGGRGSDAGSMTLRGASPATRAGRGSGRGRGRASILAPATTGQPYTRGRGGPPPGPIYQENVQARLPSQLEPAAPTRPLRPTYGTVGDPVILRTNFFAIKVRKAPFYDHIVTVEPKTDIRRLRTRLFQLLEQSPSIQPHLSYIAHDNSQRLVSAKRLPQPLQVPIQFYEDNEQGPGPNAKVYTVSIALEREFDSTELEK
jgi:hypothetical protein